MIMGEYFKPWRRKIGVVTLAMACVFMGAWIRSQLICDFFGRFHNGTFLLEFEALNGNLVWCSTSKPWFTGKPEPLRWIVHVAPNDFKLFEENSIHWSTQFLGFAIGEMEPPVWPVRELWWRNRPIWVIPYWHIVIPLTLLSAYLLLSKTKQPTGPQANA